VRCLLRDRIFRPEVHLDARGRDIHGANYARWLGFSRRVTIAEDGGARSAVAFTSGVLSLFSIQSCNFYTTRGAASDTLASCANTFPSYARTRRKRVFPDKVTFVANPTTKRPTRARFVFLVPGGRRLGESENEDQEIFVVRSGLLRRFETRISNARLKHRCRRDTVVNAMSMASPLSKSARSIRAERYRSDGSKCGSLGGSRSRTTIN